MTNIKFTIWAVSDDYHHVRFGLSSMGIIPNTYENKIASPCMPHGEKVTVGNDQEKAQSERNSHSKNRGGKN